MRAQVTIERGACALLCAPDVEVRDDDIEAAFRWLKAWDVLIPFKPYTRLARHEGDAAELDASLPVIHNALQPVYDPRVLFIKRGTSADELLAALDEEEARCGHDNNCGLPLLRAVWRVKPLLLALPAGWVGERSAA